MEIRKKNLQKYLRAIAIDQLVDDYSANGYKTSTGEKIGKFQADLVVRNNKETIVFEIKTEKTTKRRRKEIERLTEDIKELGYKFRVILAKPPANKNIEVESIEQILTNEFIHGEMPSELDSLSTHTSIDEVIDIEIDEIAIRERGDIFITGDGVVVVTLQWGSDSDERNGDGTKMGDSYPFRFSGTFRFGENGSLRLEELTELDIDTASYYE